MTTAPYSRRRRSAGIAAVELALMLPVIVLVLMSLVDLARGMQANMILINLSREGANLSKRNYLSLADSAQTIIGQLAASAPPLDLNNRGMLYITRVMGKASGSTTRTIVLEQYRWDDSVNNRGFRVSGYAPTSKVWTCGNWASGVSGTCSVPTDTSAPVISLMSGQLADGEEVYVVEAFYKFNMVFSTITAGSLGLGTIGPDLYSMTIF
jgi:hypothetical protein